MIRRVLSFVESSLSIFDLALLYVAAYCAAVMGMYIILINALALLDN